MSVDATHDTTILPAAPAGRLIHPLWVRVTHWVNALAMLGQLFRYGKLGYHGAFFNARTGQTSALPVDPTLWSKTRRRSRKIAA